VQGDNTVQPNITPDATPAFTRGAGLVSSLPPGVLTLDTAVAAMNSDYPATEYTIRSADLISRTGRFLYEFRIQPMDTPDNTNTLVFIDARSGKAYSPGEENAKISRDVAKKLALAAFSTIQADRCTLAFSENANDGMNWHFILYRGSAKVATGTLDASSGEVTAHAKIIQPEGRPAVPGIDAERARTIAERYIIEHNGGQLPLNMSSSQYEPVTSASGTVAGQYGFVFERTFQDYPTDVDGFTVIVDSVTGEVIGYSHQWTTPEHAFFASVEPDVIRREATFAVMQKAKEEYPDNIAGLRILSADLRWKNNLPYGTVPRPGTIPLGWKVIFDDDFIRGNTSAMPGIAWVDAQTGDFLEFDYRH
jgi:hypothetical protein